MNARQGAWLLALAALAACGQREGNVQAAAPASSAASGAAGAASAPASAAQTPPPLVPQQVPVALAVDPQQVAAGQQLATQGAQSVAACAGCHGQAGEGNAQLGTPRLAGQGRLYLLRQLDAYANGMRKNAVMQPIAAAMNADQRRAAAAYYSAQGQPPTASSEPAQRPADPVLAAQGDERRQVQGCANCHGPQGIGDAADNPYLAGQHANYLTAAMAAWKSGERQDDPSGQMPVIAKALTDDEVRTLTAYYSGLPPPAPRNAQAAPPPLAGQRAAVQSGPVAAAAPTQGTGTEQGALTGGAQGQGAGGAATNPQQTPGTGR